MCVAIQTPDKLKYRYRLRWLSVLLLAPLLTAGEPFDRVVAIVEKNIIMESELNLQLRTIAAQMEQRGAPLPPPDVLRRQVLERMVMTEIQLQRAERTGIRVDDETLNRTINNIAASNDMSLSKFREVIEKDGFSYTQFRENIRNEIAVSRLRQRQVDNRISVTSKEIDNVLANDVYRGETETEYRLQHILISLPEAPTVEEREHAKIVAEKVLSDLMEGQDFATLATNISDGQQALEGGDLGWRKKNEIPTLFSEETAKLQPGEVSNLIESSSGFHIIKLADVRSEEKYMITQTKARHILIKTDELTTDEAAQKRLQKLKTRIDNGDNFGKLARSHSDDMVSAAEGGDLGWIRPRQLVKEFEDVMNALEPEEVSEPVQTKYGWHLVQVLERREYDDTENNKREKVADTIRRRKSEEAHLNWLRHLRDEAYVEFRLDES